MNKTVRRAALIASLLGVLASCKTAGPVPVSDPFAVLGGGASVYLVVPVEANRDLLDSFAGNQKESASLLRALERTDIVYSGIFPADSGGTASARLLAQGSFSPVTAPFLFPPSKGWTRKRVTDIGTWYHSERVDAAIPKSGLVFAASGSGIEAMLGNLKNPRPVPMAPSFVSYASNAPSDGRIGLFVADAAVLTSLFMGPEVQFAVTYAEIYAQRLPEEGVSAAGSMYEISARVVLSDARTARALSTLLRFAVGAGVSLDGNSLYLTGFQVTTERLVDLARSLYVISNKKNDEVLK